MHFRVFVLLALASVAFSETSSRTRYEAGLLKIIEKCKTGDVYSLPIALPALNPLIIPSLNSQRSDFSLSLSDITVRGLDNMRVQRLYTDLDSFTTIVNFVVPRMTIDADHYVLNTEQNYYWLAMQAIYRGQFRCYINNLSVRVGVRFARDGGNTVIDILQMEYNGDVEVHFDGSPDFVNMMANQRIRQMMRDPRAISNMENIIKERASRYLRGHTPEEFINIISNI